MLPLRYALVLAAAISLTSFWVALHGAGYQAGRFYERLSVSCEKYALYGYAVGFRLAAAERYAGASALSTGRVANASRVAAEAGAEQLLTAAGLLAAQGDRGEALGLLQRAFRVAPWRSDVRARLLEAQIAAGDPAAPRQVADLAYRRDDPEAQCVLAKLLQSSGRADDARALLRHAAARQPESFRIRAALARSLLATGAKGEAMQHAQASERLAGDIEQRLEAAELLRAAGSDAPARSKVLWDHGRQQYLPTALVVLVYLLALFAPSLWRRRGAAQLRVTSDE